jgi:hypothetical protein
VNRAPDSVEEEVVLPRLVKLVHLLVEVVVHPGDGVHLGLHLREFVVHASKEEVIRDGENEPSIVCFKCSYPP